MTEPWLSVVMPVLDGAAYVDAALASILAERPDGVEVIVADDGSTDGTLEKLRAWSARLPLRIIDRGGDGSWAKGANTGLRAASGRWASLLCHDDAWLPGRLAVIRRAVEVAPPPALVVHPAVFIGPAGESLGPWRCPLPPSGGDIDAETFTSRLLVQNFLASPAPVFERARALALGGFDEALWYTADWDLWLRLGRSGPIRFLPVPLAAFRIHPASLTVSRAGRADELRRQMRAVLERHLPASEDGRLAAVAAFSVELNTALAGAERGEPVRWGALAGRFAALGPAGWHRYLRDSRIADRLTARLRLSRLTRAATARRAGP